jgi:hypothetical protein
MCAVFSLNIKRARGRERERGEREREEREREGEREREREERMSDTVLKGQWRENQLTNGGYSSRQATPMPAQCQHSVKVFLLGTQC